MEKLELWLNKRFAPVARAISERPWVKIIGDSMQNILPFILTGSVIFFYNVIRSYITQLPDLGFIITYSFGLIALISCFMVARQAMIKFNQNDYEIIAPVTAVAVFMIFAKPQVVDGMTQFNMGKFGPVGILGGMIVGVIVAQVFRLYAWIPLRSKLRNSDLPDFVSGWINSIIPIILSIVTATLFTTYLDYDLFNIIAIVFAPLQKLGQTLPGLIILTMIPSLMMSMGVSSWSFNAITTPIFMLGMDVNIKLMEQGLAATEIVTNETVFTASLITMGGIGCTLALNLLLLRSKSKRLKTIGRVTIMPSLFGINEPVLFGTPVVMNPLLMLPMWLCTITGSIIVWTIMKLGLLRIPATLLFTGQLPVGFSTVIATNDWRGALWFVVLLGVYIMIYRPFFKIYEKQVLENEASK